VLFDSAGEIAMNDAMTAAEAKEELRKDAQDFVEMGSVSEETKGSVFGNWYDGGVGWYG
jgi:hypothetical protein